MEITVHPDIQDFLKVVEPSLRRHEAANNLMLGVALRVQKDPQAYGNSYFCASLHEDERLLAAALMTPPYNMIIFSDAEDCSPVWPLLIDKLKELQLEIPGVLGWKDQAWSFANTWKQKTGEEFLISTSQRTFEIRQVIPPRQPAGFMRQANMEDLSLLNCWENSFDQEALGVKNPSVSLEKTHRQIENGELYVWVDGEMVSMAASTRPIGNGISVSWVFTPPEKRCQGYAGALVAALSQHLLDSGYAYCTLFTDLANPISNSIYQRIGYKPICDYEMIGFIKP